jgi:hypothetical protein
MMYAYQKQNKQPSIIGLFANVAVILVILVYAMMSINTGDPLWFWPVFDHTPASVTLLCYGEEVTVDPSSAEFDKLTEIFNQSLSGYKNWDSLTMSELSWADYQSNDQFATLVMSYQDPVRVHSIYKYFSSVDTLVVPLDGRHAQTRAVFGMANDQPGAGSLHMETIEPLVHYVSTAGLCSIAD